MDNESSIEDALNDSATALGQKKSAEKARERYLSRLNVLENNLNDVIYGQKSQISNVCRVLKRRASGVRPPAKLAANILWKGPTGSGKTETALQIAHQLCIPYKRIDMSEYQESHEWAKMVGAPPGYIGHDATPGALTEFHDKSSQSPYALLLLDEIEKAHPEIFQRLLGMMDYGRITNGHNKVLNFHNVILIMTSNIGGREATKRRIGFAANTQQATDHSGIRSGFKDAAVDAYFSPEFKNRLDLIDSFNPFDDRMACAVAMKFMAQLYIDLRRNTQCPVELSLAPEIFPYIVQNGYDPAMGARSIARFIDTKIVDVIADAIISRKIQPNDYVDVSIMDDASGFLFMRSKSNFERIDINATLKQTQSESLSLAVVAPDRR